MTEPADVEPFGVRKSVHREAIARSDSDAQAIFAADKLANTLADGTLAFQLQQLTELPLAAVVVEARYGALFKLKHVNGKKKF